ncbi:MAG: DUF433 domain-containing protein [Chloroflexota bacterium]
MENVLNGTTKRQHLDQTGEMELVVEMVGGEPYEYYPLGDYVVRAVGVCGGRPTFKYTRIDVDFILSQIAHGYTVEYLVNAYSESKLTKEAITEAMMLAINAFRTHYQIPLPIVEIA